jgi:hypothetical protein
MGRPGDAVSRCYRCFFFLTTALKSSNILTEKKVLVLAGKLLSQNAWYGVPPSNVSNFMLRGAMKLYLMLPED